VTTGKARTQQRWRLVILVLYVLALLAASFIAFGSVLPPTAEKGLWLYSGIGAAILGNLLVTPFFSKPADTVSYTVAALIGLLPFKPDSLGKEVRFDQTLWAATLLFLVFLLACSLISIALKDSVGTKTTRIARSFYHVSSAIGTPRTVFSAVFLYSLLVFHRGVPREYLTISLAWILIIALQPLETFAKILSRVVNEWGSDKHSRAVGVVIGQQIPNIVLVQESPGASLRPGDLMLVQSSEGTPCIGLVLNQVGYTDAKWHRLLSLGASLGKDTTLTSSFSFREVEAGQVIPISNKELLAELNKDPVWRRKERLIGVVAPQTNLTTLQLEVVCINSDLREGALLEVEIGNQAVLYQVVNGLTREEIVKQENTRGFVTAVATKIGYWDADNRRLRTAAWIPQPHAPVYLAETTDYNFDVQAIGRFPNTSYTVEIDPDLLVTHNTAVLGILGSGKSFLTLELVERCIKAGIKVLCLDMTDQYASSLAPYFDAQLLSNEITGLQEIGRRGKTNVKQNVEEGGSTSEFRTRLKAILEAFLDQGQRENLVKILNPAEFEVWRQDSKPFQNKASMASLTPVEITRLVTEVCLEVMQGQGMTDRARCCLVFEEAHSLVPEWTSTSADHDRSACNGTAKAILQGRKFGLGCIAVTQRTANITKSILNQCNTVFALRTFDATGVEFLRHYVGDDYARLLSSLEERHCVVFGRASSCKDPALIRLNERDKFLEAFRTPDQGEQPATHEEGTT